MKDGLKYYFKQIICLWDGHDYDCSYYRPPNSFSIVVCKRCHKRIVI